MKDKQVVYVGLSGGVDSSVSAALLKEQGFDVHGVFIQTWSPEWMECNWQDERRDAMRVAIHLDIPFHDLDLSDVYKNEVADYFIKEYQEGRTPNPDVLCNRYVKFGAMFAWAKERGADFVATGHYARVSPTAPRKASEHLPLARGGNQLLISPDASKDQSYFLWTLTNEDLEHIMFPIGHLHKTEVRKLAEKFNIPVSKKKDSQGICFLGHVDMREFLSHYITLEEGDVLNTDGEVIGTHTGALVLTRGQRHGFTLFKSSKESMYVLEKDIEKNTITVGPEALLVSEKYSPEFITLKNIVWRSELPKAGDILTGVIRYHGELKEFEVILCSDSEIILKPKALDATITSGQSIVFYYDDLCLGGGVIL